MTKSKPKIETEKENIKM